jgi:hypothetical protein
VVCEAAARASAFAMFPAEALSLRQARHSLKLQDQPQGNHRFLRHHGSLRAVALVVTLGLKLAIYGRGTAAIFLAFVERATGGH